MNTTRHITYLNPAAMQHARKFRLHTADMLIRDLNISDKNILSIRFGMGCIVNNHMALSNWILDTCTAECIMITDDDYYARLHRLLQRKLMGDTD